MAQPANGQLIKVPNTLKRKVGGSFSKVDTSAIAKAEAALAALSDNFDEWIVDEVGKLEACRRAVDQGEMSGTAGRELFNCAHDLKGLGSTYGYPIVTQMADSLCEITQTQELREKAPLNLVDIHVDAIRAAVKSKIKVSDHPVGSILVNELRSKTQAFLSKL